LSGAHPVRSFCRKLSCLRRKIDKRFK
jgi:hypothetical protein